MNNNSVFATKTTPFQLICCPPSLTPTTRVGPFWRNAADRPERKANPNFSRPESCHEPDLSVLPTWPEFRYPCLLSLYVCIYVSTLFGLSDDTDPSIVLFFH